MRCRNNPPPQPWRPTVLTGTTDAAMQQGLPAGLQPYFRPKGNAVLPRHISDAFDRMTHYSMKFVNRFRSRYHRMSMAETRHHMEKAIFGERLRCRKPVSRRNEVPAREICHNVRLLAKGARS